MMVVDESEDEEGLALAGAVVVVDAVVVVVVVVAVQGTLMLELAKNQKWITLTVFAVVCGGYEPFEASTLKWQRKIPLASTPSIDSACTSANIGFVDNTISQLH